MLLSSDQRKHNCILINRIELMSKVQLIYEGVSQIVGGPELGLLVLSDLTHTRQIAIVCDLSLIHISEPTRLHKVSRMPSSA